MDKVAFLVLSYDSFTKSREWQVFFQSLRADQYNLYIHSKNKTKSSFRKYYIKDTVPTAWGYFSLVEATIQLMKESLSDKNNEYFILISDSHFPLLDGNTTVESIKKKCRGLIFHGNDKIVKGKFLGVDNYNFVHKKVSQFFMCRREHVEKFVESFDYYSQFFIKNRVTFADEFYFCAIANDLKMKYLTRQHTCYIDWSDRKNPQGKLYRKPYAFSHLSKEQIDLLIQKDYLFVRKILPHTVLC